MDRIEAGFADRFAERPCGWPVGPEKVDGPGWYTPCRTVQIVELAGSRAHRRRFEVHTFFPFRRIDLRFPPIACASLMRARRVAGDRMVEASGGAMLQTTRHAAIDLWRAGDVIGLEAIRQ